EEKKALESLIYFGKRYNYDPNATGDVSNQRLNVDSSLNEIKQNFLGMTKIQQDSILKMLRASDEGAQELADTLESLITKQSYFAGKAEDDIYHVKKAYLELLETVKGISDVNKVLEDSLGKSK